MTALDQNERVLLKDPYGRPWGVLPRHFDHETYVVCVRNIFTNVNPFSNLKTHLNRLRHTEPFVQVSERHGRSLTFLILNFLNVIYTLLMTLKQIINPRILREDLD